MGIWIKPNGLKRMTKGNAVCRPLSVEQSLKQCCCHITDCIRPNQPSALPLNTHSTNHHCIQTLVSMQSTSPPIHFSNHSTAHLRHTQPIIIPYHPLHIALAPTAARWLTVGVRCVGGMRHIVLLCDMLWLWTWHQKRMPYPEITNRICLHVN
jgi:hypothetical protein